MCITVCVNIESLMLWFFVDMDFRKLIVVPRCYSMRVSAELNLIEVLVLISQSTKCKFECNSSFDRCDKYAVSRIIVTVGGTLSKRFFFFKSCLRRKMGMLHLI